MMPLLMKHWSSLGVPASGRVFVPLAGKTLDMHWLAGRGHEVLGAELSPLAVDAFFAEAGLSPEVSNEADGVHHRAGRIDLVRGDVFALSASTLAGMSAVYDRAALIALPPAMRRRYVAEVYGRLPPGCRGLLITLALVLLAAVGGTFIGARYIYSQHHKPSLHEFVHDELNLTPDQAARLERLEQDFAVRRRAREAELRAANAELARAIQARHEYSPEVQAAVEHFHDAMGELQKETILHVLAMRTVLTPDQAQQFDARIAEALTEQAP